ncbi:hypothetical protein TNCV_4549861 [Trichonephila clavipes]|nr:hypothetical protein TNCV_4549861 [Trichonephila clavipes]
MCLAVCIPGCKCNEGLVRGPHNRCVRPEQCPARPTKGPSLVNLQQSFTGSKSGTYPKVDNSVTQFVRDVRSKALPVTLQMLQCKKKRDSLLI